MGINLQERWLKYLQHAFNDIVFGNVASVIVSLAVKKKSATYLLLKDRLRDWQLIRKTATYCFGHLFFLIRYIHFGKIRYRYCIVYAWNYCRQTAHLVIFIYQYISYTMSVNLSSKITLLQIVNVFAYKIHASSFSTNTRREAAEATGATCIYIWGQKLSYNPESVNK